MRTSPELRSNADSQSDETATDLFRPELNPQGLYLNPTLQQRLDLIEHLIEFGRQIIVISGFGGSGKSSLLGRFAAGQRTNWYCINVQAGSSLTAAGLYTLVARELDVDAASDESAGAIDRIRTRLAALERAGKIPVLLLDDADQLLPDAIASVIKLAHTNDQLSELRVLMAADLSESTLLEGLQREHPQHGLVHVVEIPRLQEADTRALIEHSLTRAGRDPSDYFTADDFAAIHADSDGLAGNVITLARQHLTGRPTRSGTRGSSRAELGSSRWKRTVGFGVLALAALGIGAWWAARTAPTLETPEPGTVEVVPVTPPAAALPRPEEDLKTPAVATVPNPSPTAPAPAVVPDGVETVEEVTVPDEPAPRAKLAQERFDLLPRHLPLEALYLVAVDAGVIAAVGHLEVRPRREPGPLGDLLDEHVP